MPAGHYCRCLRRPKILRRITKARSLTIRELDLFIEYGWVGRKPRTSKMSLADIARESPFARPVSRRNVNSPFGCSKHSRGRPAAFCQSSNQSGREVGDPFPWTAGALAPRALRRLWRERIAPATPNSVPRATRNRRGAHDRRANACSQRPGGGWPIEGNSSGGTRVKRRLFSNSGL